MVTATQSAEYRSKIGMTVLHRPGGKWSAEEIGKLTSRLATEAIGHPKHPEHLVILGYYTKDKTRRALGTVEPYDQMQTTGLDDNPELPFSPYS